MAKRTLQKDKSRPITSFNVLVPVKFSISANQEFEKKLRAYCKKKEIKIDKFFRRIISKELDRNEVYKKEVPNMEAVIKQVSSYKTICNEYKEELCNALSIEPSEISKFLREKTKKKWKDEGFE